MTTSDYIGPEPGVNILNAVPPIRDVALQCATAVFCAHVSGPTPMTQKPALAHAHDILTMAEEFERWLGRD